MKLDTIITVLRLKFPEIYFVYTPEIVSNTIIMRCYIPHSIIKPPSTGMSISVIEELLNRINNTVIRGVPNILHTEIIDVVKSIIDENGSIQTEKVYAISTLGTNLEAVLENPFIDKYRTQTDSIKEYEEMYGIEAARNKIINEIRKTMDSGNVIREHTTIFGDEMTYSGQVTSIQKTGLQIREMSNVLLRLSFQSPIQVIQNAAVNSLVDNISGISGPLMCGQTVNVGTCYNDVSIDRDFVESHVKQIGSKIEDLL
jgi:DNA-directed RNA polymerase beta' subunit